MQNSDRKQRNIQHLEERHSALKAQVAELDGMRHLSAEQQMRVAMLKKEKLATKDALMELRA